VLEGYVVQVIAFVGADTSSAYTAADASAFDVRELTTAHW